MANKLSIIKSDGGGLRYNQNKTPISQIPPSFIAELANHFALGMTKYPDKGLQPNWTRGQYYSTVLDGLERHLLRFKVGEAYDTDLPTSHHMIAVAWAACVLHFFDTNPELYSEYDDRIWAGLELELVYNPEHALNKDYGPSNAPNMK